MSLEVWGRVPRALRSRAPFDPYDLDQRDPAVVSAFLSVFERLNRHYLRNRIVFSPTRPSALASIAPSAGTPTRAKS